MESTQEMYLGMKVRRRKGKDEKLTREGDRRTQRQTDEGMGVPRRGGDAGTLPARGGMGLPDLANENIGDPVKFKFQIKKQVIFSISVLV